MIYSYCGNDKKFSSFSFIFSVFLFQSGNPERRVTVGKTTKCFCSSTEEWLICNHRMRVRFLPKAPECLGISYTSYIFSRSAKDRPKWAVFCFTGKGKTIEYKAVQTPSAARTSGIEHHDICRRVGGCDV